MTAKEGLARIPITFVCKGCGRSSVDKDGVHSVCRKGKWMKGRDCGNGYWRMVDVDRAFEAVFTRLAEKHNTLRAISDSIKGVLDQHYAGSEEEK